MVNPATKINRLFQLRRDKAYLEKEEGRLSEPIESNIEWLGNCHDVYEKALLEINPKANPKSVKSRKKFLFVTLYVFSPGALVGKKLRVGLRDKICEVFGDVSPSTISHLVENLVFLYSNYSSFKRDADYIANAVIRFLKDDNYIEKV